MMKKTHAQIREEGEEEGGKITIFFFRNEMNANEAIKRNYMNGQTNIYICISKECAHDILYIQKNEKKENFGKKSNHSF